MENEPRIQLSQELQDQIRTFILDMDLGSITRSLRKVFFDYLRYTSDGPDIEFNEIITDIEHIFEHLDNLSGEKVK